MLEKFSYPAEAPDIKEKLVQYIKSICGSISYKGPYDKLIGFDYCGIFLYIKLAKTKSVTKAVAHSKVFTVKDGNLEFFKSDLDKLANKNSDDKARVARLSNTISSKIDFLKLWLSHQDQSITTASGFGKVEVFLELEKTEHYAFILKLTINTATSSFLDSPIEELKYSGELRFVKFKKIIGRTPIPQIDSRLFSAKRTIQEWRTFECSAVKEAISKIHEEVNPEILKKEQEIVKCRERIAQLELEIAELNFKVSTVVDKNIKLLM